MKSGAWRRKKSERRDDIPLLVEHFLRIYGSRFEKDFDGVSGDVMSRFMRYPWPGNVRELEHAVEHACAICHDRTIMPARLPAELRGVSETKVSAPNANAMDEPQTILKALNIFDWNKAKAARILGISRQTIYRKIKGYRLTKPPEKDLFLG